MPEILSPGTPPEVPAEQEQQEGGAAHVAAGQGRLPGGGPSGRAPLIRAMRLKSPDMRRVAHGWLDRFSQDNSTALAELISLILAISDVPSRTVIERDDVQDREPDDVIQELVASLAVQASEKGADFTHHWLVSRERGAIRVRENYPMFWRELMATAPCQALLGGILQLVKGWVSALAECQFRSIRHVATAAGLHLVEGLALQCRALREFCNTAMVQVRDAEAQHAAARLTSLTSELNHARSYAHDLSAARDALGVSLMSRRTKDVDPEIRWNCYKALNGWARIDADTFSDALWTRYLHFGLNDRDARARNAALATLHDMLRSNTNCPPQAVQSLAEHVQSRILRRCHDINHSVGASAIRCAAALASRSLLKEEEFDPVIDLVWDANPERRNEAASFVSHFVFSEDIMDHPADGSPEAPLPTSSNGGATARRRILMLLQFMEEYAEGHPQLVHRLASAYWRKASCLEDWEVLACLTLPGGDHTTGGYQHTILIHLLEAVSRLAAWDSSSGKSDHVSYARSILDRAVRAFVPRISALLASCQSEPAAMRKAAALCRHLLWHCTTLWQQGAGTYNVLVSGHVGEAAAEALKVAFLRQPDPEALEYIAEALAYLLELAESVRPAIRELAAALRAKLLDLVSVPSTAASPPDDPDTGDSEASRGHALLSAATRLRILAKAFDVSFCDLRNFVSLVLGVLDDRAAAFTEGHTPSTSPQLTITLLELMLIVLTRQATALLQPEPLARCVVHDPIDREQLQLVPTAANDLCNIATVLLQSDTNPYVRSAAFAASVGLLTAWWNGSTFAQASAARASGEPAQRPWLLPLNEDLSQALWKHLGQVLLEANMVPVGTGIFQGTKDLGSQQVPSALSQLFCTLQQGVLKGGVEVDMDTTCAMTDSEHVQVAALVSTLVAICRHQDVAGGLLPALVLSQGLSPREDLQEVAWVLMRRLRKEAHWSAENLESFFMLLLRAVRAVHQDASKEVARDLSSRLLQHVCVGKLVPMLQAGIVVALRAGIEQALADDTRDGFLEALLPWVTRHIIEDDTLKELADWAASTIQDAERAERAGLPAFVKACCTTAEKRRRDGTEAEGEPGKRHRNSTPEATSPQLALERQS